MFYLKLDLVNIHGGLTSQNYVDEILTPYVEPHTDNHTLADRSVFMQGGQPFIWQGSLRTFLATRRLNTFEN